MFISRISRHRFGAYAALLLLEILSTHHRCSARKNSNHCAPSSCGNFHHISFPFRLSNDSKSCGHKFFELACENNERLTLQLNMEKYYVEAINYSDSTIRLVDAAVQKDDCFSIPHHSLTEEELSSLYFHYDNDIYYNLDKNWTESSVLAFICCENEIQNLPDYIMDTSSCKNGSGTAHNSSPGCVNMEGHSYVMVGGLIEDLPDLCSVNLMYTIPKNVRNMSYKDVHDILADGFELQWSKDTYPTQYLSDLFFEALKLQFFEALTSLLDFLFKALDLFFEVPLRIICRANNLVRRGAFYCPDYPFTITPIAALLLIFPILFLNLIVIYHVLLFPCGLPCLLALLIYKWRRRHLSMYDNIEKFLQSHDNDLVPIRYTYSEIKKITNGFKDKFTGCY